jgi:hypothetical protein
VLAGIKHAFFVIFHALFCLKLEIRLCVSEYDKAMLVQFVVEINDYARVIGLDPNVDKHLMYIAKEGIKARLPENWKPW